MNSIQKIKRIFSETCRFISQTVWGWHINHELISLASSFKSFKKYQPIKKILMLICNTAKRESISNLRAKESWTRYDERKAKAQRYVMIISCNSNYCRKFSVIYNTRSFKRRIWCLLMTFIIRLIVFSTTEKSQIIYKYDIEIIL